MARLDRRAVEDHRSADESHGTWRERIGRLRLQGRERGEALARARTARAIAASRTGAQPSLPTAAELEEILAR
jgi:hypothetical protein